MSFKSFSAEDHILNWMTCSGFPWLEKEKIIKSCAARALKAIFLAKEGDSCLLILKQTWNGREQIKRASGKQAQYSTERVGSVWCVLLSSFFPALLATKAEMDFDSGANWAVLQTPTPARYLTNTIHQRQGICCGCVCVCMCVCGCEDVKVCRDVFACLWVCGCLKRWKTNRWWIF